MTKFYAKLQLPLVSASVDLSGL